MNYSNSVGLAKSCAATPSDLGRGGVTLRLLAIRVQLNDSAHVILLLKSRRFRYAWGGGHALLDKFELSHRHRQFSGDDGF